MTTHARTQTVTAETRVHYCSLTSTSKLTATGFTPVTLFVLPLYVCCLKVAHWWECLQLPGFNPHVCVSVCNAAGVSPPQCCGRVYVCRVLLGVYVWCCLSSRSSPTVTPRGSSLRERQRERKRERECLGCPSHPHTPNTDGLEINSLSSPDVCSAVCSSRLIYSNATP